MSETFDLTKDAKKTWGSGQNTKKRSGRKEQQ